MTTETRSKYYTLCLYTALTAAVGCVGLSACDIGGELHAEEAVGSRTQALGVGDDCPAGTSYDFTYGNAKLLLCSHKDIFSSNSNVKRAIVVIRGSGWTTKGYDDYYQKTYDEALAAGMNLDKLDIIAPRLLRHDVCKSGICEKYGASCTQDSDCQPAGYYRWSGSYVGGGQDATGNGVPSYEVLDSLLFQLAANRPNLEVIVVAGQSQGAQLVNRYAPSTSLDSGGGTTLRFWSANPATYPWLDSTRPNPSEALQCTVGYNDWMFGLDDLYQYHLDRNIDAEDIRTRLFEKDIVWTVGENDAGSWPEEEHCTLSQGADRYDRWQNYRQHTYDTCLARNLPGCESLRDNQFSVIPNAGHGMDGSWEHPIGHKILFGTVHANCSESAVDYEVFDGGGANMVGCAGAMSYTDRDSLCAPGYSACSADQWVSFRSGGTPHYNYWTSSALKYGGSGDGSCWADTASGSSCPSGTPMRVCTDDPSGTDSLGNTCNWDHCGYAGSTSNEYFGGCVGNLTAGTLCCPLPQ